MKREYPDTPLIGVGAIVIEDGRVSLVKRGHPPLLGEWSIPGGAMEVGETVREATARSQVATSWQPAAVAVACTAAITGCGSVTICCMTVLHSLMM